MTPAEVAATHLADHIPAFELEPCPARKIAGRDDSVTTPLQVLGGVGLIAFVFAVVGWVL